MPTPCVSQSVPGHVASAPHTRFGMKNTSIKSIWSSKCSPPQSIRKQSLPPVSRNQIPATHDITASSFLCRAASLVDEAVQRDDGVEETGTNGHHTLDLPWAGSEGDGDVVEPECFSLEPGQLGPVNRDADSAAADVFRCSGCTLTECQAGHSP